MEAPGVRSDGFKTRVLPVARAVGMDHSGTVCQHESWPNTGEVTDSLLGN
jgi:hypothetical protein